MLSFIHQIDGLERDDCFTSYKVAISELFGTDHDMRYQPVVGLDHHLSDDPYLPILPVYDGSNARLNRAVRYGWAFAGYPGQGNHAAHTGHPCGHFLRHMLELAGGHFPTDMNPSMEGVYRKDVGAGALVS